MVRLSNVLLYFTLTSTSLRALISYHSVNVCNNSVQNLRSSRFLPTNLQIKIDKTIIFITFMGVKFGLSP